jgi:hypothetical protein
VTADERAAEAVAILKSLGADGRIARPELPYDEILRRPEQYLGPFASLPATLRASLLRLYREEEEVRTLARGPLSQSLAYAGAFLSRTLYQAERLMARAETMGGRLGAGAGALRKRLRRTARRSARVPFRVRGWLHHMNSRLQWHLGRRDLATVLCANQFDMRPLGYAYLEGLQQVPGCEAVSKPAHAPLTYSLLVGFDFVKSGGTYWFLEANWNPSLMDERLALYEADQDPWVNNLLGCATARGYRRVVVYGYRPFSPGHAATLVAAGARRGIDVEIIDDLFSSRHAAHQRALLMHNGASLPAFVVRAKGYDVLFDRAILSKRQTRQIVEHAAIDWASAGAALPGLIGRGAATPNYESGSRYPNIVAKRDGVDRGAGVWFYKLPRTPEMPAQAVDYFEEYRVPDPCAAKLIRGVETPLAAGDARAWKIRSFALLTPEGVEYLSSIKVISGLSIPPRLPDGEVACKNIYLVTVNEGGFYSAVTAAEDAECRRAVIALGDALLGWMRLKYAADDLAA